MNPLGCADRYAFHSQGRTRATGATVGIEYGSRWDNYIAQIDGPASIFLDLEPPPPDVVVALKYLLGVRIALHAPDLRGLSTRDEFEALCGVEDELTEFIATLAGRLVGRYTVDGTRTFFAYIAADDLDTSKLHVRLGARGYAPEMWVELDPDWKTYHEWLYPHPEELQAIQDRRTLDALAGQGDDHSVPRDVDHWVYFRSADGRSAFMQDIQGEGFTVRQQRDEVEVDGLPLMRVMNTGVRQATPADCDRLVELMREFYAEAAYPLNEDRARAAFHDLLRDDRLGFVWLVDVDGVSVGYVVITLGYSMEYGGRDAFVDDLFVQPGHRGRGVGRAVLAAARDMCTAIGVRALHLEVGRDNTAAQSLYRQLGFVDTDRQLLTLRLADPTHVL